MPPILFLDIDGVLVPCGDGVPTYPVFDTRCVANLKMLLAGVPSAKVVFSTTWRLPNYVNRLHDQWREHGFPVALAIDGTPDLLQAPSVLRRHQRGLEIRAWLNAHPRTRHWVVVDDERFAIEEVLDSRRCVFTNPRIGLTADDVERAIRILRLHGGFPGDAPL